MLLPDENFTPGESIDDPVRLHHVLLTRFSLDVFRGRADMRPVHDTAAWVAERTPVFREVCLPSVLGQDRRPRRWLIGADETRPELVAELFAELKPHSWIRPAWQRRRDDGTMLSVKHTFAQAIAEHTPDRDFDYLVTTRLDNDDALNRYYVRWVERYITGYLARHPDTPEFWVSFPVGAQLAQGRYYAYHHTRGHFLTRVVRADVAGEVPIRHALAIKHTAVFEQGTPVATPATKQPMWLEHVHEQNLMNEALDHLLELVPSERVGAMFAQPAPPPPASGTRASGTSWWERLRGRPAPG